MEGQQGLLATWRHHCSRSHMLQPFLFLWLVMTARMLASVAAVIASSCVRMMNCSSTGNSERWLPGGAAQPSVLPAAALSSAQSVQCAGIKPIAQSVRRARSHTCGTSSGASAPGAASEAHRQSGALHLSGSQSYHAGPAAAGGRGLRPTCRGGRGGGSLGGAPANTD